MTTQTVATGRLFERAHLARAADGLAVAVAASLPWSTSISGILVVLWGLAVLPTLDLPSLRRSVSIPATAIVIALVALAVLGMTWGDASLAERVGSIKAFLRLLVIPVLFVQFRNSDRGMWVLGGFLVSCTVLLALSSLLGAFPSLAWRGGNSPPGVPFKDYIVQSTEFVICAFALAHVAITKWRSGRRGQAIVLAVWALAFLANIVFVATGRSTLVIFAALLPVLGFQRFQWKGVVAVIGVGVILAGVAWMSSPYLRERVLAVAKEIQQYETQNAETSSGYRLEFWKKSARFIADAPVLGHGTGSVIGLFRKAATGESGPSAAVTDQPHNQTLLIAIQLGLIGAALLFAMWGAHLMLFRGSGMAAWLGIGIVVQNIVACLFNSYLSEFTLGWLYIFGVGVLGGMMLRQREAANAPDSVVAPGGKGR
jgi:O-antigen ligase